MSEMTQTGESQRPLPTEDQFTKSVEQYHTVVRVSRDCRRCDDAFTRVRIILKNGIESEAVRFQHACDRMNKDFQLALAKIPLDARSSRSDSVT